ncbi:serrate RNA effector molecule homolog [Episyrphus balteatus]|uniref:serrate RNA effector molecule homolog n=1 Tax=Episyrphus balteatus TaxID=286459 RepID=UPI0024864225|nr:serrate RNA effector molecule homolog [Episyrphus balteatus]
MADSDDEYDRKRRDKFRGERSSGESYRSERRIDDRRREEWSDRNPFRSGRTRPDYRDYRGPREKFSPGRELPPAKRIRPDWGEDIRQNSRYGGYDQYLLHNWGHDHYPNHAMHAYHLPSNSHPRGGGGGEIGMSLNDLQTQPAMLTLKQFLDTQEDGISDSDVLRKYGEYKLDFKRQQLNEFFVTHKDEEWFKNKYHPTESIKRKLEQRSFLKRRAAVFYELLENGTVSKVTLDSSQTDQLLRLLDTVVIKLEGGTDEDLKVLDEPLPEIKYPEKITEVVSSNNDNRPKEITPKVEVSSSPKRVSPRREASTNNEDEENWDEDDTQDPMVSESKFKTDNKRKRSRSQSSNSSSSNSDEEVDADHPKPDSSTKDKEKPAEEENDDRRSEELEETEVKTELVNEAEESEKPSAVVPEEAKKTTTTDSDEKKNEVNQEDNSDPIPDDKIKDTIPKIEIDDTTETIDLDKEKPTIQLQALHRTSSIFLRNLAPTITKAEIEAICQRFAGFLRVAIADPLAERRWFRRGWVTFKRDVNIKEICWNLNNTRLRDCEIGAIVNRDLSRRVRPVNGITAHSTIVRSDIKLCAKIALNLDEKFNLWDEEQKKDDENVETGKDSTSSSYGFKTNNPVLQNITDFLIEEASAEEDELLGIAADNKDSSEGETIERDSQIISVLDKLILYLRIVHSVDFYNHCEYPYEDEMPNRCGIIHARGPSPQNKVTNNDIQDYIKNFENKLQTFLTKPAQIEEEELKNLGLKDPTTEVEKFVQVNTQELAKDKWLCPLSGKKFKGPEFIKKHIFNKHGDKVDEVRNEVEYFNNYLKDPKRPQLPEHSGNVRRTNSESAGHPGFRPGAGGGYMAAAYAPPYSTYAPPMIMGGRGGGRGFGGGRRELPLEHPRRVIGYHDLDAPTNFDMFD